MTFTEFTRLVNEVLLQVRGRLPPLARMFHEKLGRGVISLQWDAEGPADEDRMHLGYLQTEHLLDHKFLKKLVLEYDPAQEFLVVANSSEGYEVIEHFRFAELELAEPAPPATDSPGSAPTFPHELN